MNNYRVLVYALNGEGKEEPAIVEQVSADSPADALRKLAKDLDDTQHEPRITA